jgi:hypothetical protein
MTVQTKRKYKPGDRVLAPVVDGAQPWPGAITDGNAHKFCTTCHCEPTDPDHRGDGSLCCPGPWYAVKIDSDDCGDGEGTPMAFAEHELIPA